MTHFVGGIGAVAGDQFAVLMGMAGDVLIDDLNAQRLQFFAHKPLHLTGHVAQLRCLCVQRVGEGADFVILEQIILRRFTHASGQQGSGAMAEGDDVAVVLHRPVQGSFDIGAVRQADQRAVAAGDKQREIVRVVTQALGEHVGQLQGLLELRQVLVVDGFDFGIFAGEGPVLELDRVARLRGDVKSKTGFVEVVHRQQRFDGVVAGRKQRAVLHWQVALIGGDHQDFPASALVRLRIVGTA